RRSRNSASGCRAGECNFRCDRCPIEERAIPKSELLEANGNGTQEAQEAQDFFLFLVPLVLLVFRSLFWTLPIASYDFSSSSSAESSSGKSSHSGRGCGPA